MTCAYIKSPKKASRLGTPCTTLKAMTILDDVGVALAAQKAIGVRGRRGRRKAGFGLLRPRAFAQPALVGTVRLPHLTKARLGGTCGDLRASVGNAAAKPGAPEANVRPVIRWQLSNSDTPRSERAQPLTATF